MPARSVSVNAALVISRAFNFGIVASTQHAPGDLLQPVDAQSLQRPALRELPQPSSVTLWRIEPEHLQGRQGGQVRHRPWSGETSLHAEPQVSKPTQVRQGGKPFVRHGGIAVQVQTLQTGQLAQRPQSFVGQSVPGPRGGLAATTSSRFEPILRPSVPRAW
jgi:hypothetical protein